MVAWSGMQEHFVTYWWMSPGHISSGTRMVQAEEAICDPGDWLRHGGVAELRIKGSPCDPPSAIDKLVDEEMAARQLSRKADVAKTDAIVLSVVARRPPPAPRAPGVGVILGPPLEVEGPYDIADGVLTPTYFGDIVGSPVGNQKMQAKNWARTYGYTSEKNLYAVTGLVGGDDTRLLQILTADHVDQVLEIINRWVTNEYPHLDASDISIYSIVEALDSSTNVYVPSAGSPEPVAARPGPSTIDRWFRGDYTQRWSIPYGSAAASIFDPRDVDTVNRHRQLIGADPLDLSAGWTPQEIADMAENIRTKGRTHNPRHAKLKRRLMR